MLEAKNLSFSYTILEEIILINRKQRRFSATADTCDNLYDLLILPLNQPVEIMFPF